eukprot:214668-Rhodomonas_salina.1
MWRIQVQDTGRPAVGVAASSPAVGVATSSPAVSASVEMTPTPVEEDTQTPTKTTPTKGLFSLFSRVSSSCPRPPFAASFPRGAPTDGLHRSSPLMQSPAKDASTPKAAEKGDGSTEVGHPSVLSLRTLLNTLHGVCVCVFVSESESESESDALCWQTPMPNKGAKFAPSPEAGAKPVASNKERY